MRRWTTVDYASAPISSLGTIFWNSEIFNNFQQKYIFRFVNEIFGFFFGNFIQKELNFDTALNIARHEKNRKSIFGIWNFRSWRYDEQDDAASIGSNENDKKVCFIEASNLVSPGDRKRFYILSILDDVLEDRPLLFERIVQFLSFGPSTFRHLDRRLYDLGPFIWPVRPILSLTAV